MANIKTIIDELSTIATAFGSINTFKLDELSSINDDLAKIYPLLLVNSRDINFSKDGFSKNYLPKRKKYTLKLFFLDTYKESEQVLTDKQTKYSKLETIAEQFLAELKRRTVDAYLGFDFERTSNGFEVDKVHNDNLIQFFVSIDVTVRQDCTLGTFTY